MGKRKKTEPQQSRWTEEDVVSTAVRLAPELLDCLMDCNMHLLTLYRPGEWPECVKLALSLIGQTQGLKP